jgi:hypothetical protein
MLVLIARKNEHPQMQPDFSNNVGIIPTASEVFGGNLDINECKSVLSTINRDSAIHVLCLLKNMHERIFRSDMKRNSKDYLIHFHFLLSFILDQNHATMVRTIFQENIDNFSPFSDQALAATLVFACKSSDVKGGLTLETVEERMQLIPFENEQYLVIRFNRSQIMLGIEYVVEVSENFHNWNSGPSFTTVLVDTESALIVQDNTPITTAPQRAMRLRVIRE